MKLKALISRLNELYDEHQSTDVYLPNFIEQINDVVVEDVVELDNNKKIIKKIIVIKSESE